MPPIVRLASNLLWALLAFALRGRLGADLPADPASWSGSASRRPTQRMGSLYFYAVMRAITFRRMRVPVPRVEIGEKI